MNAISPNNPTGRPDTVTTSTLRMAADTCLANARAELEAAARLGRAGGLDESHALMLRSLRDQCADLLREHGLYEGKR